MFFCGLLSGLLLGGLLKGEKEERKMRNKHVWFGAIIGFILSLIIIFPFILNSGIIISTIKLFVFISLFLIANGLLIGYLVEKKKILFIGGYLGFLFGLFNPWIIQIGPLYTFGVYYLKIFGTKFEGGNWHLISYIPIFILIWTIIGLIIVYLIKKLFEKKGGNNV